MILFIQIITASIQMGQILYPKNVTKSYYICLNEDEKRSSCPGVCKGKRKTISA